MTERYGAGYGDEESGQRPSGRGAVTERLARSDDEAREVDLTDEAAQRDEHDEQVVDRESADAFEPAAPSADPPAGATEPGSASIFDLGQRAKDEDQDPTGYEPAVSDTRPAQPRGETVVTDPGEPRAEATDDGPAGNATAELAEDEASHPQATDDGPAGNATAELAEDEASRPQATDDGPAGNATAELAEDEASRGETTEVVPAPVSDPPAAVAGATSGDAGPPASLLGSLDGADIRNRFLDIQAGFVDEPRQAVEEAGRFVDDLVQQVIDALQDQRGQLGATVDETSTEDLRLALRAYRQFVDRLLGLAG